MKGNRGKDLFWCHKMILFWTRKQEQSRGDIGLSDLAVDSRTRNWICPGIRRQRENQLLIFTLSSLSSQHLLVICIYTGLYFRFWNSVNSSEDEGALLGKEGVDLCPYFFVVCTWKKQTNKSVYIGHNWHLERDIFVVNSTVDYSMFNTIPDFFPLDASSNMSLTCDYQNWWQTRPNVSWSSKTKTWMRSTIFKSFLLLLSLSLHVDNGLPR